MPLPRLTHPDEGLLTLEYRFPQVELRSHSSYHEGTLIHQIQQRNKVIMPAGAGTGDRMRIGAAVRS